jgi:hypothetical protein
MRVLVQVDVVLFMRVEELTDFMSKHPELSKWAAFALTTASSRLLMSGQLPDVPTAHHQQPHPFVW